MTRMRRKEVNGEERCVFLNPHDRHCKDYTKKTYQARVQRRESGEMGCSDEKSFDEESMEKYNHDLIFFQNSSKSII